MPAHESDSIVNLEHPSGSSAKIALYGATVTSWVVNKQERLFVSKNAILDGSKAIRGGIPLVFPVFGTNESVKLPQHGFARVSRWEYLGIATDNEDQVVVRFALSPKEINKELHDGWPHDFRLTYTVALTAVSLQTNLKIENKGKTSFKFNTLLHTYFGVQNIADVSVSGLQGCVYDDKVSGTKKETESYKQVTISSEVDRVYRDAPDQLVLHTNPGQIEIRKQGMCDTVVWNPWTAKAKAMGDFGDEEYHQMICVEVGSVAEWVSLQEGGSWEGSQTLTIEQ